VAAGNNSASRYHSLSPKRRLVTIAEQEWLKQMEGILEMLNEGVGITDEIEDILFVNECMEGLRGTPRSARIRKTVFRGVTLW
jgi:hypothetical protein